MVPVYIQIIAIIVFVYYYLRKRYNYWKDRNVAGPKPILFFGNLKESALRKKHVGIVYKEIYNNFPDEKIVGMYKMTTPALIVRDLDIIKNVMIKDFDVFSERGIDFSKKKLGDNLFHSDENVWRNLRNKLTPLFTVSKMINTIPIVSERADKLVDHIKSICRDQTEQEVYQIFRKYTISTLVAISFGLDFDTINDSEGFYERMDKELFHTSHAAELDMLYPGILQKLNISLFAKAADKLCHEIVQIVTKDRNERSSGENNLIDILIGLKQDGMNLPNKGNGEKPLDITENIMAAQVFIFYIAGYGSNASTLSNLMFRLADNPHVQDKLIEEIDDVLDRFNGEVTYETLKEMTYLDKVFLETLRMNPLTNSIQRVSLAKYTFPGTKLTIEKGTPLVISPYAIQRDEKYYPNPEKFDPERFAPENSRDRHSCAYLPFGTGPRSCLGIKLAKIQAGVCIVKFLSKFRVLPSEKTTEIGNYDPTRLFIFPKGGLYVNIVPR